MTEAIHFLALATVVTGQLVGIVICGTFIAAWTQDAAHAFGKAMADRKETAEHQRIIEEMKRNAAKFHAEMVQKAQYINPFE